MNKKEEISADEINRAMEKAEMEQSGMTNEEIALRDSINKELARKNYHLRVSYIEFSPDELLFNYVEPIDNWFEELGKVHKLIVNRIKEAQHKISDR